MSKSLYEVMYQLEQVMDLLDLEVEGLFNPLAPAELAERVAQLHNYIYYDMAMER